MIKQEYYDLRAVEGILNNKPMCIVSAFKDCLIFDEVSELFCDSYSTQESLA